MAFTIDFTRLPDLSRSATFISLGDDIVAEMGVFPEAFDRAWGAMYFCYNIQGTDATLRATDGNHSRAREAHLRAALAEFVGIEDALGRDLSAMGSTKPLLRANMTGDPLVHIVRELRNFELHLHSSRLSPQRNTAHFGGRTLEECSEVIEFNAWHVGDLHPADFAKLNNAKRYHPDDISRLLEWFNEAQKHWGVGELVRRAILRYCRYLMADHGLPTAGLPWADA